MSKTKGEEKSKTRLMKCLVTLKRITKEGIMRSGSKISASTRRRVIGKSARYSKMLRSSIYPDVTGPKPGEPETLESLKKQVKNQLEIIVRQDIQIARRDKAISMLRDELRKAKAQKSFRTKTSGAQKSPPKPLSTRKKSASFTAPSPMVSLPEPEKYRGLPESMSPRTSSLLKRANSSPEKTEDAAAAQNGPVLRKSVKLIIPTGSPLQPYLTAAGKNKSELSTKPVTLLAPPPNGTRLTAPKNSTKRAGFPETTFSVIVPPNSPPKNSMASLRPPSNGQSAVVNPVKKKLPSLKKPTQSGPPRTLQIYHDYRPQLKLKGHSSGFSNGDVDVESEEVSDAESEDLHDDIDRDPNFIVSSPLRKTNTERVRSRSGSPTVKRAHLQKTKTEAMHRKFVQPKGTLSESHVGSPFPENTLSRPTLADKLPSSLRSKLPANSSAPQSKFREFVNLKRAKINLSSQERLKTKKVLSPLKNKNKRIETKPVLESDEKLAKKRGRGRPLGSGKNSRVQAQSVAPFPSREFSKEKLPEERRPTIAWMPDLIPDEANNTCSTSEPYHIASLPIAGDCDDLSVPNSDCIEVPRCRIKYYQPANKSPGEENLDDITFLKRHAKPEEDEKRRKRWEAQKQREDSYVEKLKTRLAQRSQKNHLRRKRIRTIAEDGTEEFTTFYSDSFHPDPEEALFIQVQPEIPINIFGCELPPMPQEDFKLPWDPESMLSTLGTIRQQKKISTRRPSAPRDKSPRRSEQLANGFGKRSYL